MKGALRYHKRLKWHGEGRNRRKKNARHRVLFDELSNPARRMTLCFAVIDLSALSREIVDPQTSRHRAERSHSRVKRHADGVSAGKVKKN